MSKLPEENGVVSRSFCVEFEPSRSSYWRDRYCCRMIVRRFSQIFEELDLIEPMDRVNILIELDFASNMGVRP